MKVKVVPTIIAAAISALLAYALYSICKTEGQEILLAIGGFICLFVTFGVALGVRFENSRASVNTAVLGWVFFLILLISNGIFAFVTLHTPVYVIVNGILLLSFIGITYAIARAKQ